MILFVGGFIVGVYIGMLIMAICVTGKTEDVE